MTDSELQELVDHLATFTKHELLARCLEEATQFDWLNRENVQLYQDISDLRTGKNPQMRETVSHLTLKVDQAEQKNALLNIEIERLQERNKQLSQALDNARQMKFDAPVLCKCGCGELIKQPRTGRTREFMNDTHRKRYSRQTLQQKCHETV